MRGFAASLTPLFHRLCFSEQTTSCCVKGRSPLLGRLFTCPSFSPWMVPGDKGSCCSDTLGKTSLMSSAVVRRFCVKWPVHPSSMLSCPITWPKGDYWTSDRELAGGKGYVRVGSRTCDNDATSHCAHVAALWALQPLVLHSLCWAPLHKSFA